MPRTYTHNVYEVVSRLKSALNIKSDAELCRLINIKPAVLNHWKSRNSIGDPDSVLKLCEQKGLDLNYIFGRAVNESPAVVKEPSASYKTPKGIPLIPIDAVAGYGTPDVAANLIDAERYIVPEFNRQADFMIRVTGTSMAPKYFSGDVLACKKIPLRTFIQWGKVYILDTIQGVLCKRVFQSEKEGSVTLVSENKEMYPAFDISLKEIRSMAVVIGVIRLE